MYIRQHTEDSQDLDRLMQGSVSEAGNAFDRLPDVPLERGDEVESQIYIEETFQRAQRAQNSAVPAYMQNEFDDANAFAASAKTNYELTKLSFVAYNGLSEVSKTTHCDMIRIYTTRLDRRPIPAQHWFYHNTIDCIASITILSDMICSLEKSHALALRADIAFADNNEEMGNDLMWDVIWLYEKCHMLANLYDMRLICIQYNRLLGFLPEEYLPVNFLVEHDKLDQQNPPVLIAVGVVTRQAIMNRQYIYIYIYIYICVPSILRFLVV